jgi:Na+/melibiose symporter-like transporter
MQASPIQRNMDYTTPKDILLKSSTEARNSQNIESRISFITEDNDRIQTTIKLEEEEEEEASTWTSLPQKDQLVILALARFSEPLIQMSVRSYLFYQLRSFDKTLPDSAIASQAGIIQASFNAAQLCTAILWGSFSDRNGRKPVLLLGLLGTAISCVGFGFSTTFWQAITFRIIGGALNGNIGVMRTMVGEIIREKK